MGSTNSHHIQKNGTLRVCVNYRSVNELVKWDSYKFPKMNECIDAVGEAPNFFTIDVNSGYKQVEIKGSDREKAAFTSQHGLYWLFCMRFGLDNAPGTFQRTMHVMLAAIKRQFALVLLNDFVFSSSSPDEHVKNVRWDLLLLKNAVEV